MGTVNETQDDLFSWSPPVPKLGSLGAGGVTFDQARAAKRLNAQLQRVYDALLDGKWHTFSDLESIIYTRTGVRDPQASLSARIRDLRKPEILGAVIDKECLGRGLWSYRLVLASLSKLM